MDSPASKFASPTLRDESLKSTERTKFTGQLWKTHDQKAQKAGRRSTVHHPSGVKYIGDWKDNLKHDGTKYEGGWERDLKHGHGTLWTTGEDGKQQKVYTGAWREGKKHGYGTHFYSDGSRYEGEWAEGMRGGWGTMFYENGDKYEGEWDADVRHGSGTIFFANGDRFEGRFVNDVRDGRGTYYYISRGQRYDGEWKNDAPKSGEIQAISVIARPIPPLGLENPDAVLAQQFTQ